MNTQIQAVAPECIQTPAAATGLKQAGVMLYERACESEQEWMQRIQGYHTLIHFFTDRRLPQCILHSEHLKQILVAGPAAGCLFNADAYSQSNVAIYDTPGQAIVSVAEHTLMLIMMLAKRMHDVLPSMQRGEWNQTPGREIVGARVGLIGFGKIAQWLANQCHRLGAQVVVCASQGRRELVEAHGFEYAKLDDVLTSCDFISIHKRLAEDNRQLLSQQRLERLKPGAYLINTSRAELIDMSAMLELLEQNVLAGAAIDVFDEEPLAKNHPLRTHPKVIATPHNAWLTQSSINNMLNAVIAGMQGNYQQLRRIH